MECTLAVTVEWFASQCELKFTICPHTKVGREQLTFGCELDGVIEGHCCFGTNAAAGGESHVGNADVDADGSHLLSLVRVENVRCGEQAELFGLAHELDLLVVSHARLFEILSEVAVDEADRGEVLNAHEADLLELTQELGNRSEWIRSTYSSEDGRVLDDGQHFSRHLDHDRICIAVGHQTRQRASTRHSVAPRVVEAVGAQSVSESSSCD